MIFFVILAFGKAVIRSQSLKCTEANPNHNGAIGMFVSSWAKIATTLLMRSYLHELRSMCPSKSPVNYGCGAKVAIENADLMKSCVAAESASIMALVFNFADL